MFPFTRSALPLLALLALLAPPSRTLAAGLSVATPPALEGLAARLSSHWEETRGARLELRLLGTSAADGVDLVIATDKDRLDRAMPPTAAASVIEFATDSMVLAYAPPSPFAAATEKGSPWFVAVGEHPLDFGRGDPDTSPLGVRALLVLQLAGIHYDEPQLALRILRPGQAMPTSVLLRRLEQNNLGVGLLYRALAHQAGLRFLELPREIDLGDSTYAAQYRRASADVDGRISIATPIVLLAAARDESPRRPEAVELLAFLQSSRGKALLEDAGYAVPSGFPRARARGDSPLP